jgi:hypothetical protein
MKNIDAEYLNAIKSGDMEKALKMVDEPEQDAEPLAQEDTPTIKWDARNGIGSTPHQVDINYFGYVRPMSPETFRRIAHTGNWDARTIPFAVDLMQKGEAIAPPFLEVTWDEKAKVLRAYGHEGRSRTDAAMQVAPSEKIPVHIFVRNFRARNLTDQIKNAPIIPEEGGDPVFIENFTTTQILEQSNITPAQDAAYLAAVESGDMETAQRMVDKAAKAAGIPKKRLVTTLSRFFYGKAANNRNHSETVDQKATEYARTKAEAAHDSSGTDDSFDDYLYFENRRTFTTNGGDRFTIEFRDVGNDGAFEVWQVTSTNGTDVREIMLSPDDFSEVGSRVPSDPVTYDEQGNVIPLSQRFNPASDSILYQDTEQDAQPLAQSNITPAQDAEYLAAVESGDIETVQRMVDEAAVSAGLVRSKHATGAPDFTVFNRNSISAFDPDTDIQGFHFSTEATRSSSYRYQHSDGNRVMNVFLDLGRTVSRGVAERMVRDGDATDGFPNRYDTVVFLKSAGTPSLEQTKAFDLGKPVDLANGYFVKKDEHGGADLYHRSEPNEHITGYLDLQDAFDAHQEQHVVVRSPNQIKSADPITYDDNNNIIPLSQRFNPNNQDIRY